MIRPEVTLWGCRDVKFQELTHQPRCWAENISTKHAAVKAFHSYVHHTWTLRGGRGGGVRSAELLRWSSVLNSLLFWSAASPASWPAVACNYFLGLSQVYSHIVIRNSTNNVTGIGNTNETSKKNFLRVLNFPTITHNRSVAEFCYYMQGRCFVVVVVVVVVSLSLESASTPRRSERLSLLGEKSTSVCVMIIVICLRYNQTINWLMVCSVPCWRLPPCVGAVPSSCEPLHRYAEHLQQYTSTRQQYTSTLQQYTSTLQEYTSILVRAVHEHLYSTRASEYLWRA